MCVFFELVVLAVATSDYIIGCAARCMSDGGDIYWDVIQRFEQF
jgi:hypothetical protein